MSDYTRKRAQIGLGDVEQHPHLSSILLHSSQSASMRQRSNASGMEIKVRQSVNHEDGENGLPVYMKKRKSRPGLRLGRNFSFEKRPLVNN